MTGESAATTGASRPVAVGIDVAEERKGLDVVAMDRERGVVVSAGRQSVAATCRLVLDLGPDVVCIDSPSGWAHRGSSRTAEVALAREGIQSFRTPTDPGDHPFYRWMRVGFRVFAGIGTDYPLYRGGDVRNRAAEVFPAATATLLAGGPRPSSETKVRFRRRVLDDAGVVGDLPNADRVDAALAALTGVLALDGRHRWLGDPAEGVVLVPEHTAAGS